MQSTRMVGYALIDLEIFWNVYPDFRVCIQQTK